MDRHLFFWDGEKSTPNLLNITNSQELLIIESRQAKLVQENLIREINKNTIFDLAYIKKIHALTFNNIYEHAGAFRTVQDRNRNTNHPAAYLINRLMYSYKSRLLSKQDMNLDSTQKIINYIAQVYSDLLFLNPFLTGNVQVVFVLINSMLYKKNINSIDFTKINQIPYQEYTSALYESISFNYTPIANIIKTIM